MAARDTGSLLAVGLLLLIHTWGVRGAAEVNMEDRVEVNLGDTAQIPCMFTTEDGPGGTIIQWFYVTRNGDKKKIYSHESVLSRPEKGTHFEDRISVNTTGIGEVVLTIFNVELKDELEYICLVRSLTDGTGEGRTRLRVFHTPETNKIEGTQRGISVQEESLSKIGTCEVINGYPRPNITWYKGKTPIRTVRGEVNVVPSITTQSSGLYSVKSELSMKVVREDADELFYCEVTYSVPGGINMIETDTINITVFYPHTTLKVWVESPKGHVKEGDTVKIQCSGDGYSPSSTFGIIGPGNSSSDSNVLVVENVTRLNTGDYICSSLDMESFIELKDSATVFVNYLEDVVIKPMKIIEVAQGKEEQATCNALSSLSTETAWFKNGEEVSKGNTLLLKNTTFNTAGTYVCVVTAPEVEGLERSGALRVHVQGQPKIQTPDGTEVEESLNNMARLRCYVRGYPYANVSWSTSEGKVLAAAETGTDDGVISEASVKVTGDLTVFCNASNTFGADSAAFSIKAILYTTPETTSPTTTSTTTDAPVIPETAIPPKKVTKEGSGVIIAVIIICILLLAVLGSVLYFLYKRGKICGRSGKQDLSKGKPGKDNIVVEMKSDNTEEAVLLGVNGEKLSPSDQ